jgi:hypothetical protein
LLPLESGNHDVGFCSEEDCSRSKSSLGRVEDKAEESSLVVSGSLLAQEPARQIAEAAFGVDEGAQNKMPQTRSLQLKSYNNVEAVGQDGRHFDR